MRGENFERRERVRVLFGFFFNFFYLILFYFFFVGVFIGGGVAVREML